MKISDTDRSLQTAHDRAGSDAAPRRYLNAVRLILLPFAILSVIVLARDGFRIPLNVYFDRLLDVYDDTFRTLVLLIFEPVIKMVLSLVEYWLQIELTLLPHWKYIFVLWWLVFGAIARAIPAYDARVNATVWHVWGGVCALLGGVAAGLAPLSSGGFVLYASGLFFYMCVVNMYAAALDGLTVGSALLAIGRAFILTIGLCTFAGIFYDPRDDGYGLKVLLTTIAVFACGIVVIAIGGTRYKAASNGASFWREYLGDHEITAALDVLTVLGGAAIILCIAYLAD